MPREQINFPRWRGDDQRPPLVRAEDGSVPDSSGGPEYLSEPVLHLNWAKAEAGGHVQISMEMDTSLIEEVVAGARSQRTPTVSMFTEVLSREAINRLITVLRKARDQAYGRDA